MRKRSSWNKQPRGDARPEQALSASNGREVRGETDREKRPCGTPPFSASIPGNKLPGYLHLVPPGQSTRSALLLAGVAAFHLSLPSL
jgi:hypothetical protein